MLLTLASDICLHVRTDRFDAFFFLGRRQLPNSPRPQQTVIPFDHRIRVSQDEGGGKPLAGLLNLPAFVTKNNFPTTSSAHFVIIQIAKMVVVLFVLESSS